MKSTLDRPNEQVHSAPHGLRVAGFAVAIGSLVPVLYLVVRALGNDDPIGVLTEARTVGLLVRTIGLAVAVTASSLAIGVPLAWLTVRTDLPGRRVIAVLASMPLAIPTYVGAFTVIAALGPRGIVADLLGVRLPEIYGFVGAWLTLTLFTYPIVLLTVRAAVRSLDPSMEEAAASLGFTRREVFRRIVVPQLRPSIVTGGLLVALYTLHDFGAVSLMRFDSFTRGIYLSYTASFDRSRAAVLSLVLVALALVIVGAESRTRGRARYHRAHGTIKRRAPIVALGRRRWIAIAACVVLIMLALGMPLGVLLYWLARSARSSVWGGIAITSIHSVTVSLVAAITGLIAAWPVAYLGVRHPSRSSRLIEGSTVLGYSLPGLVVALSLVFLGARFVPALYQTIPLLVFAYVVLFLPQTTGPLRASLLTVPPSVEDAARALGIKRARALRRVVLPMVRPGIVSAFALVFLTVMKELPATLLLAPTGYETLATRVWNSTSASFFDRAAPPALILVLLASVPLTILMIKERYGARAG